MSDVLREVLKAIIARPSFLTGLPDEDDKPRSRFERMPAVTKDSSSVKDLRDNGRWDYDDLRARKAFADEVFFASLPRADSGFG